jgi:hypothetical protein
MNQTLLFKADVINRDCDAIDWLLRAKDTIKVVHDSHRRYCEREDCSLSKEIPIVPPPIKNVVSEEFLFDDEKSIPLVTNLYRNMAESVAMKELQVPCEIEFYESNSSEPDVDVLIEKAIPVVAQILKYQYKLAEMGFSDKINEMYCYDLINEDDVRKLAKSLR